MTPPSEPGFANGFDFEAAVTAPFRMQPGLRRMAAGARHLTPLRPGSPAQREKLAVLSAYAPEALLQAPGTDPGSALDAVCRHAAQEHPEHWAWDGRRASARRLGVAIASGTVEELASGAFGHGDEIGRCLRALPERWRLAGLLALTFLEDLALVDSRSGHVPWMAVTLPSHWAPAEKVGRHFGAIHEPVADNRLLIGAADGLMRLVCGPERWERQVWTVTDHPRLHAHPARIDPGRWGPEPVSAIPALAWWRTERQTFLPVPGRDEAVFTIAVDVQPLARAISSAGRARALHAALASMSDAVLHYRGLTAVREPLLRWLDDVAGTDPARPGPT